jgi:WD40 repeat protein
MGKPGVWLGLAWVYFFLASPLSAGEHKPKATFTGHTDTVACVAISPDGKIIASGGHDNTIRLWNVATGKPLTTLKAARHGLDSVAFSPDGMTLAAGNGGNAIKLWDVGTYTDTTLRNKISQYAGPLVVFNSDGKALASGGRCIREIRLWNVTTGKQTATLAGHDAYGIRAMVFTPDGKTLATVGYHGEIKLWDVATARNTATHKLDATHVPRATFSLNGKMLAAVRGSVIVEKNKRNVVKDPECLKLWEVATGKELGTLEAPAAHVRAIVFSPDGKTLAAGSEGGTIKLWDVATRKERDAFKAHTAEVSCLSFSADSRMLISGSDDKTVKLWDVATRKK